MSPCATLRFVFSAARLFSFLGVLCVDHTHTHTHEFLTPVQESIGARSAVPHVHTAGTYGRVHIYFQVYQLRIYCAPRSGPVQIAAELLYVRRSLCASVCACVCVCRVRFLICPAEM